MKSLLLQPIQWNMVGIVVGIFTAVCVVVTLVILLVVKLCKQDSDRTVEEILEQLAGVNCGGCGCSGCAGFAERLAHGKARLCDCHVTDHEHKQNIANKLGIPYEGTKPTVSVCRCRGGENAKTAFYYVGATDCVEQDAICGGAKACKYGCLGDGNCQDVCPENAIAMKEECAEVNPDRCISCGACLYACPRGLFERIPADAKTYVACSSHEKGKAVLDVCQVGCIACGKCAKSCPSGAIQMVDNLPVIDYGKCIKCGACADICPRHTIVKRY